MKHPYEALENDYLRITLEDKRTHTSELIELKDGNDYIPILTSLKGFSTLIFTDNANFSSKPLSFKSKTADQLIYQALDPEISVTLKIEMIESNLIHVKYDIENITNIKLSKLGANYNILIESDPTFKWVPHIRPKENYVIGDHVFRSPVIIYSKNKYCFALIPDLDILAENRPSQTFMDLNLQPVEDGRAPYIYYGFGKYKPTEHVFFKYNPKKKINIKKKSSFSFGYFIKVFNGMSVTDILESINNLLWTKYGHRLINETLNPQVIPYDLNVKEGFNAIFERHKYFTTFNINDHECGGSFQASWVGKRKKKLKFVTPKEAQAHTTGNFGQRIDPNSLLGRIIWYFANSLWWLKRFAWFTSRFAIMKRVAEIWNNAWFMNIRTGYSLRYFGELWDKPELKDAADKMLNTVLNLPRTRGMFPTVVFPDEFDATEYCTVNGLKAFIYTNDFNTVDVSLALYWALKFYQDFDPQPEILEKCMEFLDLIEEIQLENGAIPVYLQFEEDKKTPIIQDLLLDSASSGAPLMFLTEYYKVSQDKRILPIAKKIANYLQTEIIPQDKWHDFEPFFSCTNYPLDIYCDYTQSHVMNCLCIYWCAEGLKGLHKATNQPEYLQSGERVLAILSLFQQVWNLPYISYNTFGGFGSQNADAELSDARQGLFVRVYMEYYLITGKPEYMERAIATLRACWAVQLLSEYKEQCPGNLTGLNTVDGIDRGCVFENYGHLGNDYRVPGYIFPDWGIGTSASATAYVKHHFGDLFLDFKEQYAWGLDGILIHSTEMLESRVNLTLDILPGKNSVIIKARYVPSEKIEIYFNNKSLGWINKEDLESGFNYQLK